MRGGAERELVDAVCADGLGSRETLCALCDQVKRQGKYFADDFREIFKHHLPVLPEDMPCLIDPLPEQWSLSTVGKGSKLGAALDRLDPPLNLHMLLTN